MNQSHYSLGDAGVLSWYGPNYHGEHQSVSSLDDGLPFISSLSLSTLFSTMIPVLMGILLFMYIHTAWTLETIKEPRNTRHPPHLPYIIPVVGNLISYLLDAAQLASSITFGSSSIVRLNFLGRDIYVVSGAEYINCVWKNTKGMTSTNGINIALRNMFNTSKQDMKFFEADRSGITYDPHPQSSTKANDRVFYLMHKATVDCLAGSHITIADARFQAALKTRIEALPVQTEWVEMEDLFDFLRPLVSCSTIEAMCGATFLKTFPDFVENFWSFNCSMPTLLQGWPRWMKPKAWRARDKCITMMKQWRKSSNEQNFDGNAMMLRRWSYFSKMEGLSEDGVACSDLGILWGMNSNSMPATFWLLWHMLRDRSLLARATAEVEACRTTPLDRGLTFDSATLTNQPLLQSSYAETLRLCVAVYIIRKPEYEDAQVLSYSIPKGKMVVTSSATAHMVKRNWNLGLKGEHPVETFWAERFLTYNDIDTQSTSPLSTRSTDTSSDSTTNTSSLSTASKSDPSRPRFSLNGYSGAWIPFGGGIHQCPGRHWVKLQMLLSFAMINNSFELELLAKKDDLAVDMSKYGLGALQPAEKVPFRIRRKGTVE